MKILIAATAVAVAVPGVADAARWQSISGRQATLERRIDMGVRSGSLTRAEASKVRTQFANLKRLEYAYRRNGLSYRERVSLDRKYNALSQHIYAQKHDRQMRRTARPHGHR